MRLWHKDLIPVLPRQQLLGQWRECCSIASNIAEKGTPNHILVNRVLEYPLSHFFAYGLLVIREMGKRGYKCDWTKFSENIQYAFESFPDEKDIFAEWHDDRYLWQCYYNLQEKYDCGGIYEDEWEQIALFMERKAFEEWLKNYNEHFGLN